jgi:DNA-binding NarL/FixJ family response regulator
MTERFLIVDDHPLFREALQNAIHLAYPQAEIRDTDSIETAQDVLASDAGFDLLLLDLSMPGTRGLEGLQVGTEAGGNESVPATQMRSHLLPAAALPNASLQGSLTSAR